MNYVYFLLRNHYGRLMSWFFMIFSRKTYSRKWYTTFEKKNKKEKKKFSSPGKMRLTILLKKVQKCLTLPLRLDSSMQSHSVGQILFDTSHVRSSIISPGNFLLIREFSVHVSTRQQKQKQRVGFCLDCIPLVPLLLGLRLLHANFVTQCAVTSVN